MLNITNYCTKHRRIDYATKSDLQEAEILSFDIIQKRVKNSNCYQEFYNFVLKANGKIFERKISYGLSDYEIVILTEIRYKCLLWSCKFFYCPDNYSRNDLQFFLNCEYLDYYKDCSLGLNLILSNFISKQQEYDYSKQISYPTISSNISTSFDNLKIKLYEFQKRNIQKMMDIEDSSHNWSEIDLRFTFDRLNHAKIDPITNKIDSNSTFYIKSQGGILADEMGLGKTICSIALIQMNQSRFLNEKRNNKIYSKATVIICPSHLCQQWEDEISKNFPDLKIITVLTKTHHEKLYYKNFQECHVIIVSQQFIMNFSYYPQLRIVYPQKANSLKNSKYSFDSRFKDLEKNIPEDMNEKTPNFEHFSFHRLIVDESHEMFANFGCVNEYFQHWLKRFDSEFKWYISGTPFLNIESVEECYEYLNVQIKHEEHGTLQSNSYKFIELLSKNKSNHEILKKIMIRNQKIDVAEELDVPKYKETNIWVELTPIEKTIYENAVEKEYSEEKLQKICCHIFVSYDYSDHDLKREIDLNSVKNVLIETNNNIIEKYTKKILSINNQEGNTSRISTYKNKIAEAKYLIQTLEKISDSHLHSQQNCIICMDPYILPVLTPCGHMFCKICFYTAYRIKKVCPICKNNLKDKEIYSIESTKTSNFLIEKYGSKLGKLISIVQELVKNDENRILIFSQWDIMLQIIGKTLEFNGVSNSFIKGNIWCRNMAIRKFKEGLEEKVIMLSLQNAASGTNLQEASHIIFVEPIQGHHNKEMEAIEKQAIGRACRLGQKKNVEIIRIFTKNTIEERIFYEKKKNN